MKRYKPEKWFTYTRLVIVFAVVFLLGRTTNVMYDVITVENTNELKSLSQNVISENKEEIYTTENPVLTKYLSLPEKGFILSADNKKYDLYGLDYDKFVAVVASESRANKDDVLAVMTVILNRADRYGTDPVSVVAMPYQFSCYTGTGTVVSDNVSSVMRDALNGVRNHNYYSFNGWFSSVSDNYIVSGGNRYY